MSKLDYIHQELGEISAEHIFQLNGTTFTYSIIPFNVSEEVIRQELLDAGYEPSSISSLLKKPEITDVYKEQLLGNPHYLLKLTLYGLVAPPNVFFLSTKVLPTGVMRYTFHIGDNCLLGELKVVEGKVLRSPTWFEPKAWTQIAELDTSSAQPIDIYAAMCEVLVTYLGQPELSNVMRSNGYFPEVKVSAINPVEI